MVCAVVGSSVTVEHPSADWMELGGVELGSSGGIRNHNSQHVSVHVFDSTHVQVLTQLYMEVCIIHKFS